MNAIRCADPKQRRPLAALHANRLALRAWTALDMMARCTAGKAEWDDLVDAYNLTEALMMMGRYETGPLLPHLQGTHDGLVVASRCAEGRRQMGPAIQSMREVVTRYDEALGKFSLGTLNEARDFVIEKCFRSKDDPNVTVIG